MLLIALVFGLLASHLTVLDEARMHWIVLPPAKHSRILACRQLRLGSRQPDQQNHT
jgi:hypothetical protein